MTSVKLLLTKMQKKNDLSCSVLGQMLHINNRRNCAMVF